MIAHWKCVGHMRYQASRLITWDEIEASPLEEKAANWVGRLWAFAAIFTVGNFVLSWWLHLQ